MKVMLALVLILSLASSSLTAVTLTRQGRNQRDIAAITKKNCTGINRLDATITKALRRSLKTIPTLSYYKQHPKERARVLAQTREEINSFAPQNCL